MGILRSTKQLKDAFHAWKTASDNYLAELKPLISQESCDHIDNNAEDHRRPEIILNLAALENVLEQLKESLTPLDVTLKVTGDSRLLSRGTILGFNIDQYAARRLASSDDVPAVRDVCNLMKTSPLKSRSLLRRKKPTIEDIRRAPKRITSKNGPFGGYQMFFFEGRWYYTHQHTVNREPHICPICNKKLPRKTHSIVHHKNGTRLNNDPSNLQLVTRSEHFWLHAGGKVILAEKPNKVRRAATGKRLTPRPAFLERRITWG